jgi:pectate lyase-like protein
MGSAARPPTAFTAAGSMPGEVVLADAAAAGATSVRLNVSVTTPALGWLMIDPYGPQCELRQIAGVAGESVTFAPGLSLAHGAGATVLWMDTPTHDVRLFGAKGDGKTNDTPSIQRAIDSACDPAMGKGGVVLFTSGVYRLGSPGLTAWDQVALLGIGWETPAGQAPIEGVNGSWLYVDEPGTTAVTVTGRGTTIKDIAIAHAQPAPTTDPAWAPTDYPYAISIQADDVRLESLLLRNPTRGISLFHSPDIPTGRVTMERIWGQPLREGIRMDHLLDVVKIHNVHFWPFWSNDVVASQRANAQAFVSLRNDNPHFSDIFIFGYQTGFLFGAGAAGVTSRFLISNVGLDFTTEAIKVTAGGTTGQVSNLYQVGNDPGAIGLHIAADDVRIQMSNVRVSELGRNGVKVEGEGSTVILENLWIDGWNQAGAGAPAVELAPNNTGYVGRGRFFERGNGAPDIGGGGNAVIDA